MTHSTQKRVVNKLTLRQQVALAELVKSQFADSNLDDHEFAELAMQNLGFQVTHANVQGTREAFDIPSRRWLNAAAKMPGNAPEAILALERRLVALEQRVQVYLDGCRKDSSRGDRS